MQTSKKLPKPETTRAYLISSGIQVPTWTVHYYYATRPIRGSENEYEYIFACFKTGAQRRWGTYYFEPVPAQTETVVEGN